MTPTRYKALLNSRGLSQRGGAATLFGVGERTARRFAADPPKTAQLVLVLMHEYGLKADEVEKLLAEHGGDQP